jgi:hypothetical protein
MSYGTCLGCRRKAQLNVYQYCNACQIGYESKGEHPHEVLYKSSGGTYSTIPNALLGLVCFGLGFAIGWLKAGLIFIVGFLVFRLLNRLAESYPLVKWVMVAINLFIVYMILDAFGVFG